jgi:hypothetical protein
MQPPINLDDASAPNEPKNQRPINLSNSNAIVDKALPPINLGNNAQPPLDLTQEQPFQSSGVDAQESARATSAQAQQVGEDERSKQVIQGALDIGNIVQVQNTAQPGTIESGIDLAGGALKFLQKHAGRHMTEGMINAINLAAEIQAQGDLLWKQVQGQKVDPALITGAKPLDKQAQRVHDAPSLFSHLPSGSPAQLLGRKFLSGLGGEDVLLPPNMEKAAEQSLPQLKVSLPIFGDIHASKVIEGAMSMAGDLPFFALASEYAPIGARAVAGDIAEATAKASLPALKLAKVKALQTVAATIDGALQGSVLAAKEGQSKAEGALVGGVAGAALHKGGELLTRGAGAKAEVLASEVRRGALLPGITWKQYLAEIGAEDTSVRKPLFKLGNELHDYTFKQATLDDKGNVWEVRKARDVSDGKTKIVYRAPLDNKDSVQAFISSGVRHMVADREAASVLIDKVASFEPGYKEFKEGTIKSNAQLQNDFIEENKILYQDNTYVPGQKQYSGRGTPGNEINPHTEPTLNRAPTSNERGAKAEKPVLLVVNAKGHVKATPVNEGRIDPTTQTPEQANIKVGDMVATPDGQVGEVSHVRDNEPTVNIKVGGQSVQADKYSVKQVSDSQAPLDLVDPNDPNVNWDLAKLTIPRVAKKTGLNEVDAAHLLADLERNGAVTHDGEGGFYVNKKSLPAPVGHMVYYDTSADGQGKVAIVRGRDPNKPGNILVEKGYGKIPMGPGTQAQYAAIQSNPTMAAANIGPQDIFAKTKILSLPADQVRSWAPVLQGNAKLSDLPTQLGAHIPLPPGIVTTNVRDAARVADFSRQASNLSKLLSPVKTLQRAMMKVISHDAFLVPTDVRATGVALAAQPHVYKALTLQYQDTFDKLFGGILSPLDKQLNSAIEQNIASGAQGQAIAQIAKTHPELVGEARQTLDMALAQVKANSEFLAANGISSVNELEKLRAQGVLEEYMQNLYLKRLMQRKDFLSYVKNQLPNKYDAAVKYISGQPGMMGKGSQNVDSLMMEILGARDDIEKHIKTMPTGDARKQLLKRVKMADEINAILGKVDSAGIRIAHSLASTQCLKNQIQLSNQLAATPYWSPGPRADLSPNGIHENGYEVPNLPIWGKLRGGRVHESLAFLFKANDISSESNSFFNAISSHWKSMHVVWGGPTLWVNNAMYNFKGMIYSGGISSPSDVGTFFDAAQIMLEHHSNPVLNAKSNLYNEALQNGTVDAGFGANEITKNRAANKVIRAVIAARGGQTSIWDIMKDIKGKLQLVNEEVTAAYDIIDKIFKFTAYLNIRRDSLAKGMGLNDATALANIRVTQSFPMFSMVSPVVERMRKGNMAVIAPFLSGMVEDMRTDGVAVKRLAGGESDLWARLAYAGMVFTGAMAFNREARRANGITDAQAYAGLNSPTMKQQAWYPASFVGPELDDKGRMQLWDFSSLNGTLKLLQSHPLDPQLASIGRNIISGAVGDNNLPGRLNDMAFNAAFDLHPLSPQMSPQWKPGENGIMTTLAFLSQNAMVPGFLDKFNNVQRKGSVQSNPINAAIQPQWTPGQQSAKLSGAPFIGPVGPELDTARAMELGGIGGAMGKQMGNAVLNNMNDPEKQQRLIDAKSLGLSDAIYNYQQSQGNK